jgi:hypothetical protein
VVKSPRVGHLAHGIFGALCVVVTIGAGALGLVVALIIALVRSTAGTMRFGAALKRTIAGPSSARRWASWRWPG